MTIIVALSEGGQTTKVGIAGGAEGTTRKTGNIGEATMIIVDAPIPHRTPGLLHRPASEDHLLRTVPEGSGLRLHTIAVAPDRRYVSKQTGTI